MNKVKIGMLGIGNIAKGTYRTLELSRKKIEDSTEVSFEIVKILNRRPDEDRGIDIPKEKYVTDVNEILDDPEIDIVVELIGGIEPATEYMAAALSRGKHVVTANKAAIAANGEMLQRIAQENHAKLRFEASVGGGIPIINAITTALLSNEFTEILGILNGTTNYIMTQMTEYGKDYADVLKEAQEKGFAEADPTADVEGIDVANKLSILISLIFGLYIAPEDIPTHGITGITSEDIATANEFGYKIKLLASAKMVDKGKISCNVLPCFVPAGHPLAVVSNEFNAIYVTGNAVDNLMFYGKGAGPLPTGSAVMGDIIGIGKSMGKDAAYDINPLLRYDADLDFIGEGENQYYIRVTAIDQPGVLGAVASTLGKYEVGIESMVQRAGQNGGKDSVPLIFIVYKTDRKVLDKALNELIENNYVESIDNVLRVQE